MGTLRRLAKSSFSEEKFALYATAIGQASMAWNDLHEYLSRLFGLLFLATGRHQALAMWHALTLDRPRRTIFMAALQDTPKVITDQNPKLLRDVKWLLLEAEKLEDRRNNFTHAPLCLVIETDGESDAITAELVLKEGHVQPFHWGGNARAKRLAEKDLLSEFNWCRDTALTLRDFSIALDEAIDGSAPWPKRPKLPTHQPTR